MDFGGGFAVGLAAGIGSGIAIGTSQNKKNSANEIRDYIDNNGVTILDRQGRPIKTDRFLAEAISEEKCCRGNGASNPLVWVLVGLLVLTFAAGVFFFVLRTL